MNFTDLFDRITVQDIAKFLAEGQEEDLNLEFKTVAQAGMDRTDRKNLAKCISGFANSDGGVVIWGVDARKNGQGIDCASCDAQISDLRLFLSRLNELTGQAASPIVDGVRHKIIESGEDKGYAATLVPTSASGPHMAKLGEDRYFKRSGDSFYRMEHFDLEDMFGRRQRPDLQLTVSPMAVPENRERVQFYFHNKGRALAKHAGFFAIFENATIVHVSNKLTDSTAVNSNRPSVSYTEDHGVIHANDIDLRAGWADFKRLEKSHPVAITVNWYCQDMRPRAETFLVPAASATPSESSSQPA